MFSSPCWRLFRNWINSGRKFSVGAAAWHCSHNGAKLYVAFSQGNSREFCLVINKCPKIIPKRHKQFQKITSWKSWRYTNYVSKLWFGIKSDSGKLNYIKCPFKHFTNFLYIIIGVSQGPSVKGKSSFAKYFYETFWGRWNMFIYSHVPQNKMPKIKKTLSREQWRIKTNIIILKKTKSWISTTYISQSN